jgi:hypothetical protein
VTYRRGRPIDPRHHGRRAHQRRAEGAAEGRPCRLGRRPIEFNEAFAAQALAVARELNMDLDRVNVNGGAIALGHPLGATGAKLTTQLIHELGKRGGGVGMVTMCVGGGMGAAGIFEVYAN